MKKKDDRPYYEKYAWLPNVLLIIACLLSAASLVTEIYLIIR